MLTEKEQKELNELMSDPFVKAGRAAVKKKTDADKQKLYHLRWLKKQGEKAIRGEIK